MLLFSNSFNRNKHLHSFITDNIILLSIFIFEKGGEYYKCQSDINYKQELEDELSATKGKTKYLASFVLNLTLCATS